MVWCESEKAQISQIALVMAVYWFLSGFIIWQSGGGAGKDSAGLAAACRFLG